MHHIVAIRKPCNLVHGRRPYRWSLLWAKGGYNHKKVFCNWCPRSFQAALFELDVNDLIWNTLHVVGAFPLNTNDDQIRTHREASRKSLLSSFCRRDQLVAHAGGWVMEAQRAGSIGIQAGLGDWWLILDARFRVSRQLLTWFLKLRTKNCHLSMN